MINDRNKKIVLAKRLCVQFVKYIHMLKFKLFIYLEYHLHNITLTSNAITLSINCDARLSNIFAKKIAVISANALLIPQW